MKKRRTAVLLSVFLILCLIPMTAFAVDAPTLALQEDTGVNGDGITANGTMLVSGLEAGAAWEYSYNQGVNWIAGTGSSFVLDEATYPAGYILVRQTSAGVTSAGRSYPTQIVVAGNQIANGDFQQGYTGFSSNYHDNRTYPPGNMDEGRYAVVHSAHDVHSLWLTHPNITAYDHTIGSYAAGLYFAANASANPADVVWQSDSPITVKAGTAYRFEAYLMSLIGAYDTSSNYPMVKFQIGDGTSWADMGTTNVSWAPNEEGIWHLIYADGTFSKTGTYYIRFLNMQTSGYNDLGVDDIYFGVRGAAPSASDGGTNPTSPAQTFNTNNMLSLSLANDTGASMTDNITSNGQVNVSGVSASSWRYSLDNETSWTNGSGTSFTVTGDGSKSAMVQKWDSTNSVWSASTAPLEFTLDTAAPVFSSGTASGHTISLSFSEAINGNTPPAASDFQVLLDGTGSSVSSLSINGSTIVVTLADDVGNASIHLTYSRTLPNAAVSDVAGNENTSFSMDLYAVQYRANGATSGSAPATQLKNAGDAVTISGNTGSLALTGYSWVGWNTAAGGGGTDYAGGSSYTTDAALTLYAKWQANHYTVAFDAQGGGVTPTSKQVTYHAAYGALPTPTWPGHTFGGWYTQTAGGGDLITAASIVSTAAGHILYATWSLNQYTISFNPNSGSPVMPVKRFYGVALGTLPQSTRTGFTFDSWYYDTNLLNAVNAADTMPSENLTLHAGWTINSYAVTYDENGATGGAPPLSGNYDYDSIVTVSDNTGRMVCPGFSFGGWNTEVDGTGTAYLAGAQFIMPDHAVALYAVWNEIIYPETGDGAHPLLWAALAALALAAGFLLKQSVRKTAHTGR